MRILLPPSEAKAPGGSGEPLSVTGLGPGPLAATRADVLAAVAAFCRDDPARAAVELRLPAATASDDLAANAAALDAPTMPALARFTGVLYAALDAAGLPAGARAAADRAVLVFSGALGVLRATEPVPVHRVPAAASVPGVGGLTAVWRGCLTAVVPELLGDELAVDLRSTDYAALWRPARPLAGRVVPVRVLTERRVGRSWRRSVVSYASKRGKGLLARQLLLDEAAGRPFDSADDVAAAGERAGFRPDCRSLPGGQVGVDLVERATPPAATRARGSRARA